MWTIEKQRESIRNHYRNNKQYYKDKASKRTKEIREWFREYKKQYKCKICPESDSRCIDFHHRNPKDKKYTISKMPSHGCSKKLIIKEIEKCNSLCANCHRKLHGLMV